MRTREYIIFLILFTIAYIIFFIIYDIISNSLLKKKVDKRAKSLINIDEYIKFSNFYGIPTNISKEIIIEIYQELKEGKNYSISELTNKYSITNFELVTIVLYLEYLNIITKRKISIEENYIHNTTYIEQNLIQKYQGFFQQKATVESIKTINGMNTITDLTIINNNFLVPGVRYIDSKIYYVGDYL